MADIDDAIDAAILMFVRALRAENIFSKRAERLEAAAGDMLRKVLEADRAARVAAPSDGLREDAVWDALRPFLQPNGTYIIPNTTSAVAGISMALEEAATRAQPADPGGLREALDVLVRAVGDYTWLANGRRKDGECRICHAAQGVMHSAEHECGRLGAAMNVARRALDATPTGEPQNTSRMGLDARTCGCLHEGYCRESNCGHHAWQCARTSSHPAR